MFCPHCGTPYEAPASFCVKCGAQLSAPAPAPQPVVAEPQPVAVAEAQPVVAEVQPVAVAEAQPVVQPTVQPAVQPTPPPFPPQPMPLVPGEPPAVDLVRRLASSPLFLIAVICLSVSALITLIDSLFAGGTTAFIAALMEEMGADAEAVEIFEGMSSLISGSMLVGTLIGMIPIVLILIGLWMVYASAKNRQQFLNLRGLALVRGAVITQMVVFIVLMGLLLLIFVLALVVAAISGLEAVDLMDYDAIVSTVLVVLLLVLIGLLVLYIVYYRKALKSITAAVDTVRTGLPNAKVSVFVAVMCFIGAASALGTASLASLASAGANVLLGVVLIQYRNRMQALEQSAP